MLKFIHWCKYAALHSYLVRNSSVAETPGGVRGGGGSTRRGGNLIIVYSLIQSDSQLMSVSESARAFLNKLPLIHL